MIALMKEAWLLACIGYYQLSIKQMGALHQDLPGNVIRVTELRDELNAVRSNWIQS